MQKDIASGDVSFLRGDTGTCRFFRPSWCFGVELMTFVVKGTGLCRLTVTVLGTSSDKRRA
jgi:hypothetical protein